MTPNRRDAHYHFDARWRPRPRYVGAELLGFPAKVTEIIHVVTDIDVARTAWPADAIFT